MTIYRIDAVFFLVPYLLLEVGLPGALGKRVRLVALEYVRAGLRDGRLAALASPSGFGLRGCAGHVRLPAQSGQAAAGRRSRPRSLKPDSEASVIEPSVPTPAAQLE